jgi:hypothetical protein
LNSKCFFQVEQKFSDWIRGQMIFKIKKKICRVSARRLSIYNFAWGLLNATKEVYLVPENWKGANNSYGDYPTNLKAEPKILKQILEYQSYQSKQKFSKKNCVLYLKSGKKPTICMKATLRNLQARRKILKKFRNIKSTYQNENSPKFSYFFKLKFLFNLTESVFGL